MINKSRMFDIAIISRAARCVALMSIALTPCLADKPSSSRSSAVDWPDLPEPVTSFGAIRSGHSLYLYGGHAGTAHNYSTETTRGSFHELDLRSPKKWKTLPSGAPAQGAALVAHDGLIYRAGGMAPRNAPGEKDDLYSLANFARFDPGKGAWEPLASLPRPTSSHDAAVLGDYLVIGGGWEMAGNLLGKTWHDSILLLDLENLDKGWTSIPQPFKRRAIAMAAIDDLVYFIGGMDESNDTSPEVDIYNINTKAWSKGPPLPAGPMNGFGAAACSHNGTIYVSLYNQQVLAHRPGDPDWREIAQTASRRFFHRMVYLPDRDGLLLLGGASRTEGHTATLEFIPVAP